MRRAIVLVALCCGALLAACDGVSDATPTPTAEARSSATVLERPIPTATPSIDAPTPEPTPPSPPGPRRTGDPALDAIIEAVEARDVDALVGMVELQEAECRSEPDMSWHPQCEDGQADGTIVSGIVQGSCEGGLVRSVRDVLAVFVDDTDGFWAGAAASDSFNRRPWAPPDTLLVFHDVVVHASGSMSHLAKYVAVREGRVVGIGGSCGPAEDPMLGGLAAGILNGPWHEPLVAAEERLTGHQDLDAIIAAVAAQDVDALLGMLRTEVVECRGPADFTQIGSPPFCEDEGVPVGTQLTVATGLQCEGYLTTHTRELIGRWLVRQDGLYGVDPTSSGARLVFHGRLGGLNAGKTLSIADGEITAVGYGCAQPAEAMVSPSDLAHDPWPEPLTPRVEAVRALVAPLLDAVEAGDASPLVEATEHDFLGHGCTTSRDPNATIETFLESEPEIGWLDEWWLVFELGDDGYARLGVDARPRLAAVFQPCDATLERVTQTSTGEAAPLLWAPEE